MPKMKKCPVCGISIKLENLDKHMKKVHPKDKVEVDYSEKEERDLRRHKMKKKELERPTGLWKIGAVIAVIAIIIIAAVMLLPSQQRPPQPPMGSPAPEFELTDINGNLISIEALNDKDEIVYLDFFQTTCPHCRTNTNDTLVPIHNKYGDKIKMISISVNPSDTVEKIIKFKSDWGNPQWQYALDTDGEVWKKYIYIVTPPNTDPGTPSSALIDRNGNLFYTHAGEEDYATLAAKIDALLQ